MICKPASINAFEVFQSVFTCVVLGFQTRESNKSIINYKCEKDNKINLSEVFQKLGEISKMDKINQSVNLLLYCKISKFTSV